MEADLKPIAEKYARAGVPWTLAVFRAEQELKSREAMKRRLAKTKGKNVGVVEIRCAARGSE